MKGNVNVKLFLARVKGNENNFVDWELRRDLKKAVKAMEQLQADKKETDELYQTAGAIIENMWGLIQMVEDKLKECLPSFYEKFEEITEPYFQQRIPKKGK